MSYIQEEGPVSPRLLGSTILVYFHKSSGLAHFLEGAWRRVVERSQILGLDDVRDQRKMAVGRPGAQGEKPKNQLITITYNLVS